MHIAPPKPPPQQSTLQKIHQDYNLTSTVTVLLDIITLQGLFLYTIYLLHQLRLFRWHRDIHKVKQLCRILCFTIPAVARSVLQKKGFTARRIPIGYLIRHGDHNAEDILITIASSPPSAQTTPEAISTTANEAASQSKDSKSNVSINDMLPPEILVLVFKHLGSRPQTMMRCILVCRSWHQLLGPIVWKSPRILWSKHWPRFHPISVVRMTRPHQRAHSYEIVNSGASTRNDALYEQVQSYKEFTQKDLLIAMSSELIHDSDKHELEQWFEWKRQERAQRLQDCRRRKLLRAIRKDIRASKTTDVTRTSISKGVQPQLSKRYGLSHRFLDQSSEVNNESAENDSDDLEIEDDDDGAHYGNSEADSKRDAEDNTESETDWDASDDETPLMKLMSKFDYLQSLAAVDSLVQERQKHLNERLASRQTTTTMLFLPFSKTIVRIRQRKAIKETRHRLAQMRTLDGLPISLPLQTCGHWIQVINLQQETPFTQKVMSQPLAQYPANTASASALLSTQPYSIEHVLPEHQQNHQQHTNQQYQQQQQSNRQRIYRLLASFFNGPLRQASLDNYGELSSDLPLQQKKMSSRLESRRDFVTSKTLQTILDNCPGLCRLTLSGCQGVTDHGLGLIKQAACVRNSTLVWLHMAGCVQITDQGLLNLVIQDFKNDSSISSESTPRFESLDFSGCFQITDQSLIPLIRQCGTKLTQLKLADCKSISSECIMILTQHCPRIRWLDLGQSGGEDMLAEECLIQLAIFCPGLEWLNLSRSPPELNFDGSGGHAETEGEMRKNHGIGGFGANNWDCTQRRDANLETQQDHTRLVSDYAVAKLCQYCTKLQLLDLSYILTITDSAIESLSKTARSLVCLTIIGCPGITSRSLSFLAKLRNTNRKLSCITMGDAQGISEKDIEQVMQVALSGWQKSLVDDIHMTDILGHSWED